MKVEQSMVVKKKYIARVLLEKYGVEISHMQEVERLSKMIFDKMNLNFCKFTKKHRNYLKTAALLHDIGYYYGNKKHNISSYDMILNLLEGFDENECELIGNIARYHRGKLPSKKHFNYQRLTSSEKKIVKRLAAILRIADGLDRAHVNLIEFIDINFDQHNNILYFLLKSNIKGHKVNLKYAFKKKDLFEKTYKVQLVFKFI